MRIVGEYEGTITTNEGELPVRVQVGWLTDPLMDLLFKLGMSKGMRVRFMLPVHKSGQFKNYVIECFGMLLEGLVIDRFYNNSANAIPNRLVEIKLPDDANLPFRVTDSKILHVAVWLRRSRRSQPDKHYNASLNQIWVSDKDGWRTFIHYDSPDDFKVLANCARYIVTAPSAIKEWNPSMTRPKFIVEAKRAIDTMIAEPKMRKARKKGAAPITVMQKRLEKARLAKLMSISRPTLDRHLDYYKDSEKELQDYFDIQRKAL